MGTKLTQATTDEGIEALGPYLEAFGRLKSRCAVVAAKLLTDPSGDPSSMAVFAFDDTYADGPAFEQRVSIHPELCAKITVASFSVWLMPADMLARMAPTFGWGEDSAAFLAAPRPRTAIVLFVARGDVLIVDTCEPEMGSGGQA